MMISNEELVASNPLYQHLIDNDPDASYPWTENLEQIAKEEEEIPVPCGYTYALYSMNTTPDQQLIDYKELLAKHIAPAFAAAVPIMEFMLEEGVKVFTNMHMNWDGIQGVPLFELDWEEGAPLVMKPKCRPIKANILEVAEKEFNRLRGYLLFPSNSPVCSNIVLASKAAYPFVRICGDYVQFNKFIRSQLDRIQGFCIFNAFHILGKAVSSYSLGTIPVTFHARGYATSNRQVDGDSQRYL